MSTIICLSKQASLDFMNVTKAIANDYYCQGLTNSEIFEKYDLERKKSHISQERIFEHLSPYIHEELECFHCGAKMESKYVGKSRSVSSYNLSEQINGKGMQVGELVMIEAYDFGIMNGFDSDKAYLDMDGYKISSPYCPSCGHQLGNACECDSCEALSKERASEAADIIVNDLSKLEPINIDELTCREVYALLKNLKERIDEVSLAGKLINFKSLDFESKLPLMLIGLAELKSESAIKAIKMASINKYYVEWSALEFSVKTNEEVAQIFARLKLIALSQVRKDLGALNVIEIWESLAFNEALNVLEYYCEVYDIHYTEDDIIISEIKRSLTKYGLAQTARYIYNAVKRARNYATESGQSRYRAFTFIYRNLNFWVEDPRARTYHAPPFNRSEHVLAEPKDVEIFSRFFLEKNGICYFSDPLIMASVV